MLTTILRAILLGVIQGLTEFIPVSSSGHLVIVPWLFRWQDPALESLPFDVALHLGTLVAVLCYFAADWARLIRAWFASVAERKIGNDVDRRLAWFLILGCIPGGIAGVLAEDKIERLFHAPDAPIRSSAMIAMALIIALLGALLFLAERLAQHRRTLAQLTFRDAVAIGIAQAAAIFPGVSRSGSTITAGLALGLQREAAARFSFLLSAPIIAGAGAKSLVDVYQALRAGTIARSDLVLFPIGLIVAAISGYLCIKYLLRFVQHNSMNVFVYYRWALAGLVLVVALLRG